MKHRTITRRWKRAGLLALLLLVIASLGYEGYIKIATAFLGADRDLNLYRQAMRTMLDRTGLADSVLYIPASDWDVSHTGPAPIPGFYVHDGFHLTNLGYRSLDSCIVRTIVNHHSR